MEKMNDGACQILLAETSPEDQVRGASKADGADDKGGHK